MTSAAMLSLIRVQLLTALNLNAFVLKEKRLKAWLATLGMALCLTPSYLMIVAAQFRAFGFIKDTGLPLAPGMIVGLYAGTLWMVFLASLATVYSTLYQSNELGILLPLPYRPWQIIAAKLAAVYLLELFIGAVFLVPGLFAYYAYGFAPLAHIPVGLVGLALMPVIPLSLSTVLCMLIANVPGIGRNRWFWYVGITLALVVGALLLTSGLSALEPEAMDDLVRVQMARIGRVGRLMPGAQFAMYALADTRWTAWLHQVSHLAIVVAYILGALAFGERFYIRPILQGANVARRRHGRAESARASGVLGSIVRKELRCTLRDPAVVMNGLGGYVALPLLAVTYGMMKVQSKGKVDILGQLYAWIQSDAFARRLPLVVVGMALSLALFGSLSSLFSASYSKDGKRLWLEKSLPLDPYTIYLGKLVAGAVLITPLNLLAIAVFAMIVPFYLWQWAYVVLLSEVVLLWSAAAGLMIDCLRPKLVWKDTVQAVKQNVNVLLAMGFTSIGIGLNALGLVILGRADAPSWAVYTCGLAFNILLLGVALLGGKSASRRFVRVSV